MEGSKSINSAVDCLDPLSSHLFSFPSFVPPSFGSAPFVAFLSPFKSASPHPFTLFHTLFLSRSSFNNFDALW